MCLLRDNLAKVTLGAQPRHSLPTLHRYIPPFLLHTPHRAAQEQIRAQACTPAVLGHQLDLMKEETSVPSDCLLAPVGPPLP